MLAITLKHPWAWAICKLGKRVENRTWRPGSRLKPGDYFAIHGGKAPTGRDDLLEIGREVREIVGLHGLPAGADDVTLADVMLPGIVAVCRYGGLITGPVEPWYEGPCGWLLHDLVVLPEAVPCKGAQGLWDLPGDVLADVRIQYRAALGLERSPA